MTLVKQESYCVGFVIIMLVNKQIINDYQWAYE